MIRDLATSRNLSDGQPTLLAALPPLTIGLMLFTLALAGVPWGELVFGGRSGFSLRHFSVLYAVPAALALAVVGVAGWAVRSGLPRWGYTWLYSALVMISMALTVMGDDRPALISPVVDVFIALCLLGALAVVAWIAARRSVVDALVAGIGFAAAFVLVSFSAVAVPPFRRVDLALLALPAGLAFSLLLFCVLRSGTRMRWVAALLTAALGAGLMSLYVLAVAGPWAGTGALFATRVVQIAAIGLLVPPMMAGWFQRRQFQVLD